MRKILPDWHYARPELAEKYLNLFALGLLSARCLFARRRMGKTEFLEKDFVPAAKNEGYVTAYVNLWRLQTDPATAIVSELYKSVAPKRFEKLKIKISGKIAGVVEGAVETEVRSSKKAVGLALMDVMDAFDKTKLILMFVIDEAQVLAYAENSDFAHALRAALDIRKDRIKVIFAGSSETTLRRMFGIPSEPFYNWAPLEPFPLLGKEFVIAMVNRVNAICKFELSLDDALTAFSELKNTPEFFRRYIEHYLNNPELGSDAMLQETKRSVLSDDKFNKQWQSLQAADKVLLRMIANDVRDLYGKSAMQQLGKALGIEDSVNSSMAQNALRRLSDKNIIAKIDHGVYQFEDEAFGDWVKHRD